VLNFQTLWKLTALIPLYSCLANPLVHHGRHFGRTIHALCSVSALLTNGLLRVGELAEEPDEAFTYEFVSSTLQSSVPNLTAHNCLLSQAEKGAPSFRGIVADDPRS
jgi:hypothetical protein